MKIVLICMSVFSLISLGSFLSTLGAEETRDESRAKILTDVSELFSKNQTDTVIEYIKGLGDTNTVVQVYFDLVFDLYNKKNVDAMVLVGKSGVDFCLAQSNSLKDKDAALADKVKKTGQKMCFNLAVNTWPGWGDEGVIISKQNMAFGLEMATLDLKLGLEMEYPPEKISNSLWVIGAHYLAAADYSTSKTEFEKAKIQAEKAKQRDFVLMLEGYIALAGILAGESNADDIYRQALKKLRESTGDDAKFYADQIEKALTIFQRK